MSVRITWAPSSDADIASYGIERADASGGPYTLVATIPHDTGGANYSPSLGLFFYDDAAGTEASWYRLYATDSEGQDSGYSTPFQPSEPSTFLGTRIPITAIWDENADAPPMNEVSVRREGPRIQVPVGSSWWIDLTVTTRDGVPFDDPAAFLLTVVRKPGDSKLLQLEGEKRTRLGRGRWGIACTPAQTRRLEWGRYIYDIQGTRAADSARIQVVPVSAFVLSPALTRP